jgi:hypothetical protein
MAQSRTTSLMLDAKVFFLGAEVAVGASIGGTSSGAEAAIGDGSGCVNEGCVRKAESGKSLCATCGLERELFRREARRLASRENRQLTTSTRGSDQTSMRTSRTSLTR